MTQIPIDDDPFEAGEPRTRWELLQTEFLRLIMELQANTDFVPPDFTRDALIQSLIDSRYTPGIAKILLEQLPYLTREELMKRETWDGVWYLINYSMQQRMDPVRTRLFGDAADFGFDEVLVDAVRPISELIYRSFWQVRVSGVAHVPHDGAALLVGGHAGTQGLAGIVLGMALTLDHSAERLPRVLYDERRVRLPFMRGFLGRVGHVRASIAHGHTLLNNGQLAAVLLHNRTATAPFRQGDVVKMALETGAPIIPMHVMGADAEPLQFTNVGPLGFVRSLPIISRLNLPLITPQLVPTKWHVQFGEPIPTDAIGPAAAADRVAVMDLAHLVRERVRLLKNDQS